MKVKNENKKTTKFKEARLKSGLKQHEVAFLSSNTKRMIETLEQGYRNINKVNISSAVRLAYTMKCKLEDIVQDEEVCNMLKEIYKK